MMLPLLPVIDEGITFAGSAEAFHEKTAPLKVELRITFTVSREHHFPEACWGVKMTSGKGLTVTLNIPGDPAAQWVAGSV
jgi:hypothetical protein